MSRRKSTVRKISELDLPGKQGDILCTLLIFKSEAKQSLQDQFLYTLCQYKIRDLQKNNIQPTIGHLYQFFQILLIINLYHLIQDREIVTCELQSSLVSNCFPFLLKLNLSIKPVKWFNCGKINKVSTTFSVGYKVQPEQEINESDEIQMFSDQHALVAQILEYLRHTLNLSQKQSFRTHGRQL